MKIPIASLRRSPQNVRLSLALQRHRLLHLSQNRRSPLLPPNRFPV